MTEKPERADTSYPIKGRADGWTPLFDCVVRDLGTVGAVVYGVIDRHCQMRDGYCHAGQATLGQLTGLNDRTIRRWLLRLEEAGWIRDLDPGLQGRPHRIVTTNKVSLIMELRAAQEDRTEDPISTSSDRKSEPDRTEDPNQIGQKVRTRSDRGSDKETILGDKDKRQRRKEPAAVAPSPDSDLDQIEWNDGQGKRESPSVLDDPRAADPIGLGQACAERQEEEAAKGRPPGWTVPGGAEPIPDAMVMAWVTANGLAPEQIPKKLLSQYRRAMASAAEGLSATEEQAAQAVRHVLTHPDYAWYSYTHPKVEKFKQDVQGVLLQILSGRLRPTEDGEIIEDIPDEVLAQGTGVKAILAARRLKEREMQERGEPIPKGLFG